MTMILKKATKGTAVLFIHSAEFCQLYIAVFTLCGQASLNLSCGGNICTLVNPSDDSFAYPGFLAEKRFSKLKWNLWGEKGDKPLLAHRTTQYLQDKKKLQETKIFGTRD